MIIKEYYSTRKDGINLFKTYSDKDCYIIQVQTGAKYDVAIDVENSNYTYIETTEKIVVEEEKQL